MQFRDQEIIFNQGDPADCAYLIESGTVEIFYSVSNNNDELFLSLLGEGEIFGEMALIDISLRSANARARGTVQLQKIKREQIVEKIDQSDELIQFLIKTLIRRVKKQDDFSSAYQNDEKDVDQNQKVVKALKFEKEIEEAIIKNEFQLFHQPILDLKSRKIIGSEALIRWNKNKTEWVKPSEFIDFIEKTSLAIPFGEWVFEEAFRQFCEMKRNGIQRSISINVTGRQFFHVHFLKHLDQQIVKFGIEPQFFKIEIIERDIMKSIDLIQVLLQLRQRGFQISLDDFGTGYSSLQYLANLPIDFLKIDQSFVHSMNENSKNGSVIRSIIFLAQHLGMKVIVEGLETEDQLEKVLHWGAEYGQGFLFSKPVPFAEYIELK